jgi:hypothetical protein
MTKPITSAELRLIIDYYPASGEFRWKARTPDMFSDGRRYSASKMCEKWNKCLAGKVAGSLDGDGYIEITIFRRCYRAHRLAWLYMTGGWPDFQIDHRNLKREDNRWENLREATGSQNQFNTRRQSNNKSGYKGVFFEKVRNKYRADIRSNGVSYTIGRFSSAEEAALAYRRQAEKLNGEFARCE